jgi:RNA-binding protein NOB1
MLHIGIKVLSSNGMLIKQLRTYILRCYTCFQTTSKMDKMFCPKCGHKTLKRVCVTVNPDGSQVIHLSKRVNLTGHGKKYPLPMPKGGKHANNPILVEDQPIPQQRPSKQAMIRNNPLNFEYVAGGSLLLLRERDFFELFSIIIGSFANRKLAVCDERRLLSCCYARN